jgi:uncharacterized protein YacL
MFGFSIETALEDIMSDSDYETKKTKSLYQTKFVFLFYLMASWFFHILIWSILFSKFASLSQSVADCNTTSITYKTPDAILVVLISQFVTFTLFGITLSIQSAYIFWRIDILKGNDENRTKMWMSVTWVYSILSVTAKLFLEYGLLAALGMQTFFG